MNGPRARSDAERRAMFARMRGRPASARPAGPPTHWTSYERDKANWGKQSWWTDYERKRRADPYGEHVDLDPPGASTGFTPLDMVVDAAYEGSREQVEGRHGELAARVMDIAALALAYFGVKSGVTRALAPGSPREKTALGNLFASFGSGLSAEAVSEYRRQHPTMHPVADRALAKVEALLQTVSALTGLRGAKSAAGGAAWRYAPKATAATEARLAQAGSSVMTALRAAASKLPKGIQAAGDRLNKVYQAIAGITGNELPALAGGVKQAAQQFAAGSFREGFKSLVAPAVVTAGLAGVEGYEQSQIDRYKRQIREAWDRGEAFELPADPDPVTGALSAAAAFAIGTLGNPVEKQQRSYFGGRYTKDLADLAAYEVAYERIGALEARGALDNAQAEAERAKLAERKPWNMAGRSLYSFTPAAAGLIKYQASRFSDWVSTDTDYARIASDPALAGVQERDADTILLEDGRKVRVLGIDATEIAHKSKPGSQDEYLAREATARARQIAPDGTVVRLRAGGPEGVDMDIKYGRELRYVEAIPALVAAIPGLRKIWPGTDMGAALLDEGLAQPRYTELGAQHSRIKDYDARARAAIEAGLGVHSEEGLRQVEYHYKPKPEKPGEALNTIGNLAGTGLLTTGQSGAFRALGPAGNLAAQIWNAAMSAIGTAQHVKAGNANKGKTYSVPTGYVRDTER